MGRRRWEKRNRRGREGREGEEDGMIDQKERRE